MRSNSKLLLCTVVLLAGCEGTVQNCPHGSCLDAGQGGGTGSTGGGTSATGGGLGTGGGNQLDGGEDAGVDAGLDAGVDAGLDAGADDDAGVDAGLTDAGLGAACTLATDCASHFCVDGVCCESACAGLCEACNRPGREGTCDAFDGGLDPDNECASTLATSCGTTGSCSGARSCALYPALTECAQPTCSGNTSNVADTCDGLGTCVDRGTLACSPYACSSSSGLCKTMCVTSGDCASGFECGPSGACQVAAGAPCSAPAECASGFCVDGVCCQSACAGVCEACNLTGRAGFCDPLPAATDPANECTAQAASSCGTNGSCDGARACQLYAAGTTCLAATCGAPGVSNPADTCNGSGTCVDSGTVACSPYTCHATTGTCNVSCASPSDCLSGYTCVATVCKLVQGSVCSSASDCASGFCTDGVCCGSACNGTCESCNQPGRAGLCDPVAVGQDPANECAASPASSCGTTGVCDGARACQLYAPGTTCVAASCGAVGTSNLADTCNGSGTCVDNGTVACAPYTCNSGTGLCNATCTVSGDCQGGYTCVTGVCKLVQGSACSSGSQCAGGFCTDGVCCGSACNGTCESCNQPGRLGFCDPVPVGQDPANECPTAPASSCGTNGVCSGARACQLYAPGTTCVAASCGAVGTSNLADTCNGSGTCVDNGTVACAPYTCNSGTGLCNASCTVPGDCQGGYTCVTGVCKLVQGSACSTGSQCASGFCTDGVCCGSACNGTCESCNQPGRLGFCDPVPVGQDPANECPTTAASTCGTTGVCSGARSCSLYSPGTTCVAASCTIAGDASNLPDTCNGSGTCVDNGVASCGNYSCNVGSGTCRTTCSVAGDCSSGHTCSPPVCN